MDQFKPYPDKCLIFKISELEKVIKTLNSKKSYGLDGIPQNIVKDTFKTTNAHLLSQVNDWAINGIPENFKCARVTPLHKKGSKTDINNYRPISNLPVFSKLFEKCLLLRLEEELPEMEGEHQHGFRKGHSTTTALLTLQSKLAKLNDERTPGIIYSIDLSAAFDLLRPDKFHKIFKDKMSEGLFFSIMDFLTNRSFRVVVDESESDIKILDRGCVQGSVLGPKLFSLYMGGIGDLLRSQNVDLVSYADDTYVIVTGNDLNDTKVMTERTIETHILYLRELGMIVNENKTEIMWIGKNESGINHIKVNGTKCKMVSSMKALGIYIQGDLNWDTQAEFAIKKSYKLLGCLKFLRKYLTEEQFLKVVSAHYYGTVFYAANVWFHCSKAKFKTKFESLHFRLLKIATRTFSLERQQLTERCKRATPDEWCNFITASTVIKVYNSKMPRFLFDTLEMNYFEEPRKQGIGYFFDNSKTTRGKQSIQNRLHFMRSIDKPWTNLAEPLSNDAIRVLLKDTFFPYYSEPQITSNQIQNQNLDDIGPMGPIDQLK